jgi:Family of unknown function (DUF5719)
MSRKPARKTRHFSHLFSILMSILCAALLAVGMLGALVPACLAAPAPVTARNSVWYLAEGSTAWGFSTGIAIENPNPVEVTARITYMDTAYPAGKGIIKTRDVALPAASETWLNPDSDLGYPYDFSTRVECLEGLPIAVERSMGWLGGMGQAFGAQDSIGVTSPATSWYLPEGSSAWGFECWTLVQNPNNTEANITITYMVEGAGARAFARKVPAYSRVTYNMADDIGAADASIEVTSDIPVIPERSMYDYWTLESASVGLEAGTRVRREGACSIGSTTPSTDYFLAEGTTAWGFTTYVLVQNPNKAEATVTLTYDTGTGPITDAAFTIPPESRKTVRVNDLHPDMDLSTHVHADIPIVAERSMFWAYDPTPGLAMSDSIGVDSPHLNWFLPDGRVSNEDNGTETYTLVQNPNPVDVQILVSYLRPGGSGNVTFTDTVKANSRKTYNMSDKLSETTAATVVRCILQPGRPGQVIGPNGVIVEHSIYYGGRWSGVNSIGAYEDPVI